MSCRFNLEDAFLHALGERRAEGVALYPEVDKDKRPLSGLYLVYHDGKVRGHLQVTAGVDASGLCTVEWTESYVSNERCSHYSSGLPEHDTYKPLSFGNSNYLPSKGSFRTLLTPLPHGRCLVTETDIAWRVDPDIEARKWIQEEHHYDPAKD
jgi:hypothetical protein